jgi:hypothetical protein
MRTQYHIEKPHTAKAHTVWDTLDNYNYKYLQMISQNSKRKDFEKINLNSILIKSEENK